MSLLHASQKGNILEIFTGLNFSKFRIQTLRHSIKSFSWLNSSPLGTEAFLLLAIWRVRYQGSTPTHLITRKIGHGRKKTFVPRFKCMGLKIPESKAFKVSKYYKLPAKYLYCSLTCTATTNNLDILNN